METFYPLAVDILGKENGSEVRLALQGLLRRMGEVRFGMIAVEKGDGGGRGGAGVGVGGNHQPATPGATPTSPTGKGGYFVRRGSRGR